MGDLLQFILGQQDQFRRARLPSLFSDFTTQRQTNPNGYAANVKTWEDVLCKAAGAGLVTGQDGHIRRVSLEIGPHLLQKLESKEWGRPLGLNAVISEAITQGRMIPYHAFMSSPNSIYSRRWIDLPWRFVLWSLEQIGLQHRDLISNLRTPKQFVLIPNLEEAYPKLVTYLQRRRSHVDRILTWEMFRRDSATALGVTNELSDSDIAVLLKYLARDRRILAYDNHVVRLAAPDEVPLPISKEDREIASLKSLMRDINVQIGSLETRITALRERSQEAVVHNNRSSALAALRSKKAAETALARRNDTLSQLEEIYGKIEQASDQITMVQAMKGSTEVLRGLNARVGSTQDVENALDSLKEEMGMVADVSTTLSQVGQETNGVDEDDVDEELEALMRERQGEEEEKAAEETKRRLANLQTPVDVDQETADRLTMADDNKRTIGLVASEPSVQEETRVLERLSLDEQLASSPDAVQDSHNQASNRNAALQML